MQLTEGYFFFFLEVVSVFILLVVSVDILLVVSGAILLVVSGAILLDVSVIVVESVVVFSEVPLLLHAAIAAAMANIAKSFFIVLWF